MTTTQHPTPLAEQEPVAVTHGPTRSPWPLIAAITLADVVGPGTAWLLLYAPLTPLQRIGTAAGIPVGLALVAAFTTRFGRRARQ